MVSFKMTIFKGLLALCPQRASRLIRLITSPIETLAAGDEIADKEIRSLLSGAQREEFESRPINRLSMPFIAVAVSAIN
jgi:hypothetical protein